jgi:hypothetical protein
MRGFVLFVAVTCCVLLQACAPEEDNTSKSFTYTITDSAGTLLSGSHLAIVHSKATPCGGGGTYSGYKRSTSTLITSPFGPVVLKFTLDFPGAYLEGGYMDLGNSGRLSDGDTVLGTGTVVSISAICYGSMDDVPKSRTLDWTLDLLPLFGGKATWMGGTQSF